MAAQPPYHKSEGGKVEEREREVPLYTSRGAGVRGSGGSCAPRNELYPATWGVTSKKLSSLLDSRARSVIYFWVRLLEIPGVVSSTCP